MAWASSYLGSNIVSSYLHIDNLRSDLVAGKFWDKSDGTETKYTQVSHDSTRGKISVSSGLLQILPRGATHYFSIDHDGVQAVLNTSTGEIRTAVNFATINKKFIARDSSGNKSIEIDHNGTNPRILNSGTGSGNLQLAGSSTNYIQIGSGTGQSRAYFYDSTLAAWRYIKIDNGVVVVGT